MSMNNTTPAKRNLFKKRVQLKPYEYPELLQYKDAITHSFWIWSEYNYSADIQNFKTDINQMERNTITRAMLAISQIEVTVKRFWSDLYYYFPKPEIDMIGVTMGESEVRHLETYSKLLELLGMNDEFDRIHEIPQLMKRVDYMDLFMRDKNKDSQRFVLSLVLFSLFIEHISLYSQFLTIQSFNKHRNLFKGISNAISASFLDEDVHGNFGIALYHILKNEHSELFTEELYKDLNEMAEQAFTAEMDIVDWIFEDGDLDFITADIVKNYVKYRYNRSFEALGLPKPHDVNLHLLDEVNWFELEVRVTKENDFFHKRSTDYTKRSGDGLADESLF